MKILIVRACAIGDFVLNLPALAALQKDHPGATFTLVGYRDTLELARDVVDVKGIYSIENQPWSRLFFEPLTELEFDRAIVWMKDSAIADNLRRSGLPEVLHAPPFPERVHAAVHLLNTVHLPAPELPDHWKPTTGNLILHPGSGSPTKCWPHFLTLATLLKSPIFLLGPAESNFNSESFPCLENRSLPEVRRILASSLAYVGNDSGITHLAGYLGVPTVALFGPTDPRVWGPIGRRVRILRSPSISDVLNALPTNC